jgi:ABC-2 type transport system permease protein
LRSIAHHELRTLIRDGRFWASAVLFSVLVLVTLFVGLSDHRDQESTAKRIEASLREQWENQKEKDPHAAGHFGTYIMKPAGPAGWLDPGIEPYLGSVILLEAHVRNEFEHRPAADSTTLRHLGYFSPALLLQVVAPLFVILFSFSAFAADRESGVLRLVLSTGVKPVTLIGGKLVGTLMGTGIIVLPGLVVALFTLGSSNSLENLSRLALLCFGYLLYFSAFACLTLAVSAFSSKAQNALVAMIFFWIFTCFILPRTISDFAASQYPLPSRAAFADRIARETLKGIDGHDVSDERRTPLLNATLKKYGVDRVEDLPVNFDAIALQASEEYTSSLYTREFNRVADQLEAQASVSRAMAIIAPFFAIRNWSGALAGTDLRHQRRFSDAAESYRQNLIKTLNQDMVENSRTGEFGYFVDQSFWKKIKKFQYSNPGWSWSLSQIWTQLGVLVLWSGVSIGICLAASSRIRP